MNQGYTNNQPNGGDYYENYYHDEGDPYQQPWSNEGTFDGQYDDPSSQNYYYEGATNNPDQFDEYYGDGGDNAEYYPDTQPSYESYDEQYYQDSASDLVDTASLFYPTHPPLVMHNYGYDTQGDPISAVSPSDACEYKLTYVASHTASDQRRPSNAPGAAKLKSFRGSRMTVLYENAAVDAAVERRNIYSSFVAHPEGDGDMLNELHSALFGDGTTPALMGSAMPGSSATHKPRPSNSYGPPFGPPYLVSKSMSAITNMYNPQYTRAEEKHCMGITSILPVQGGRVCTISPYGIRMHTRGGMLISDKEGMTGQTCGSLLPGAEFVLAGGMPRNGGRNVHCLDLRRDLKVVSSHTLKCDSSISGSKTSVTVTDMAINHDRNTVVAGCTDGTIRLLDGERRMVEVAKARAQRGGVAKVAVYDNLICATGYSSTGVTSVNSPVPYPFPSHVLIYDVRYLGRGGIPHMSTSRTGPRFATFLPRGCIPGMDSGEDPFLLVGSGQTFGGFELMTPFQTGGGTSFFQPDLASGESMTTVSYNDGELIIGTSYGRLLQYGLANYQRTTHAGRDTSEILFGSVKPLYVSESGKAFGGRVGEKNDLPKETLEMPPFIPLPPELSIDPSVLMEGHKAWNVFNSYVMTAGPIISEENMPLHSYFAAGAVNKTSLGPMASKALVAPSKRWLSKKLVAAKEDGRDGGMSQGSAVTHSTKIDLLAPHWNTPHDISDKKLGGRFATGSKPTDEMTFPNPNKLLYSKLYSEFYDADADPRKKLVTQSEDVDEEDGIRKEQSGIPQRYRALIRPPFYKINSFDFALYNDTQLWIGWDYNPAWSNSWANPVLTLLYFLREIRSSALQLQLHHHMAPISKQPGKYSRCLVSVISELGLLFNLIEQLPVNGMIHPDGTVKPFVASNFISAFTLLPEASNLALLDGVASSVELSRRPIAFYRFLVQYLDKELMQLGEGNIIDQLQGIDFVSVIEYSSATKPKVSENRSLTLDLSYDQKWNYAKAEAPIRFCDVLGLSLCKETPLRAYCDESASYESVIQRKIASTLPSLLCCCAGTETGLQFWQNNEIQNWLPEFIEVQIAEDKSISVKELIKDQDGHETWITSCRKLSLPASLIQSLGSDYPQHLPTKKLYSLQAVVSFIRGVSNDSTTDLGANDAHHVVHVRVPQGLAKETLSRQLRKIQECVAEKETATNQRQQCTLVTDISLLAMKSRQEQVQKNLIEVEERIRNAKEDEWLLINGLKVIKTSAEDVRSFNAGFKEPCIVLFREINDITSETGREQLEEAGEALVPASVMETVSLSNGCGPLFANLGDLPGKGDLVAIDCEFVCVQAEKSRLTSSGAKSITSESRNALARLSVIDCRTNDVIIDDYVLPNESVVDCLTRFSGVRESDLDIENSPHHLVTTREAYLKVRLLMERGCLFVGHGLNQDFRVINISIPPNQIIDTTEIYHQPNQRYISLRFLCNYVLDRDMQQEVHDSVEDARASYELYKIALSLKSEGKFDEFLVQLYAEGHKTQFKLI
ncbi:hypothetical protein HJC23_000164 [Cyclotella cryptica]|uniref:Exonuclease domain-containing protein n=1 Tax=Cyclotella cryptica TaxID=29204 RepID=A0ABD3QDI4_9STRA|eukprot:CCRYP_006331-RB/>CCRYP_006331-RB protein AED:0.08 eAED:0.08 QI:213/1/1/1/0.75/0.6/5/1722/1517